MWNELKDCNYSELGSTQNLSFWEKMEEAMDVNVIPVGEGITIIVKVSGDLFLQGESQMEVRFQSSEDRIKVNQSNDTLYIETHASLDLVVPRSVPVIVEKTGGSAFVQDLDQTLVIQKVGGDLALRRISALRLDKVGGSCLIDDANQPATIQKIGGDLTLRHVVAPVHIGSIGGTGNLQVEGGGAVEARAGADLRVYLQGLEGAVTLRAGSNVDLYLPSSVNAQVVLDSGAESIDIALNRQLEKLVQFYNLRRSEFKLGDGGVQVEIRAGSDIHVRDQESEPASITGDLDRRENAWKEARERHGQAFSWSGGFGFDRSSAWADMISRRAQEAARRAEHRTHAAMRRTEDQIRNAAEREIRHAETRFGMGMPPVPPPPPPHAPRVTEQERLLVLQMLQDNKITVEQAEKLLAALEGKFDR
jgi:hypothetical protein